VAKTDRDKINTLLEQAKELRATAEMLIKESETLKRKVERNLGRPKKESK
jgi:ribosomal protein L17